MESDKHKPYLKNNSVLIEAEQFLKEIISLEKDDKKLIDLPRKINQNEFITGKRNNDEEFKESKPLKYEIEKFINVQPNQSSEKEKYNNNVNNIETTSNINNQKLNFFNQVENINSLKSRKNELEEENEHLSKLVDKFQKQLDIEKEISLKENEEFHKLTEEYNLSLEDLKAKNQSLNEENKDLKLNLSLRNREIDFLQKQSINFFSIIKQLKDEYDNRENKYKEEIDILKREKDKMSKLIVEIEYQFQMEKKNLISEYNERLFQFKEKEKIRLTEIENLLNSLEIENNNLKQTFDNFQKKNKNIENDNKKVYYSLQNNIDLKKMLTIDKFDTISSLKNEIEFLEDRINKNNSILRDFEFSKAKGNEESKIMIFTIMKQLEEDTETLLQIKKKVIDLKKIR